MTAPKPSEAVLLKLGELAVHAKHLTVPDRASEMAPVGLRKIQNERRRAVERIQLLLADPELRAYLAELKLEEVSP